MNILMRFHGRFQTKLVEGKENAYLSQKLATIVSDLGVEIDLDQAKPDQFDPSESQRAVQNPGIWIPVEPAFSG